MKNTRGLTLVELMITVAIVGIGILVVIGSFRYISTGNQYSKAKTLSNNLLMEEVEKLKNLQYYSLLVTTSAVAVDNRFNPPLVYDLGNYPPQTLIQGGITFTRATRVDFAYQSGGAISTTSWTSSDTGLKEITTYTIWQDDSGLRYEEMHNLMSNPAANPLNATIRGTVTSSGGSPVRGAVVKTIDNPAWYAITDAAGNYQFNVSSGNYTVTCSSQGYFSKDSHAAALVGSPATVNFTLTLMSSGTASGFAYLNDHLVISQVVANVDTTNDLEYVELYNPTTSAILIGTNLTNTTPNVAVVLWDDSNNSYIHRLWYSNTTIPSHGFYLISNTGTPSSSVSGCNSFTVAGTVVAPDACWRYVSSPNHAIECGTQPCSGGSSPDAGGVSLGNSQSYVSVPGPINSSQWPTNKIDSMAWSKNNSGHSCPSGATEGSCIGSSGALGSNEQLVRRTSPVSLVAMTGRAYDSNSNSVDFQDTTPITFVPYTSINSYAPIAGTPAAGAYVTANDPLSNTAQCDANGHFNAPGIATGTWTLSVSTNTYYLEVSNVQITGGATSGVTNATTSPPWPAINFNNVLLNDTTGYAFISGVVTDVNNSPIPGIQVLAGGKITYTGPNGRYFVAAPAGDVLIVANNNYNNTQYGSQSSLLLGAVAGQVYDNPAFSTPSTWFTLTQAGDIVGYFQTSSQTPLPGQTLVALSGGNQVAQAVSDNTGHAYLTNLSTGTYTIAPALDPASAVSPAQVAVTLANTGVATAYSTFTVTTGLAQITGKVSIASTSEPITTGVLMVASSTTLAGGSTTPPPSVNGAFGPLCAPCYYSGSSDSTGQFNISVRSSTQPYKVYGWYTTFNGSTPTTTRKGPYSLDISTPGVVISQNVPW